MSKNRVHYVCQQCGRAAVKPLGRCPQCGAWNSMVAEIIKPDPRAQPSTFGEAASAPRRFSDIEGDVEARIPLPLEEFSRVLGGGIVPGSVVLIGGDPGIGKSTLLLQMVLLLAADQPILYISGEESERQIKSRGLRLTSDRSFPQELYLLTETNLESIIGHVEKLHPNVVVVDSIQAVYLPDIDSAPGSISQVRASAARLQALAKTMDMAVFLVGHVTKEGAIAGPRVLEHIVDTVLYLEGDSFHAYRLLRSVKNRFGATTEVGVFELRGSGMIEIANPSEAFLAERAVNAPGSAIAVTMEGTRPLLVEVQGLTSTTSFGHARRTANGIDFNRLLLIVAVLTRRIGLKLTDQDVFVNVVGGLRVHEPAADLSIAAAIASSVWDRPMPADMALIGEIGLSGELRPVSQMSARVREASKLGFRQLLIPKGVRREKAWPDDAVVFEASSLQRALSAISDKT